MTTAGLTKGHTVIVVHGTFAAPDDRQPDTVDTPHQTWWYLKEGAFCQRLDAIWSAHNVSWRCWAHGGRPFFWSGANTWIERLRAGNALAVYLKGLIGEHWRCAVVAHSHGGNVLLHALERLSEHERSQLGPVCFMGTPFYEFEGATPALEADRDRQNRRYLWAVIAVCALAYLHAWSAAWKISPVEWILLTVLSVFGAVAVALKAQAFVDALTIDVELGIGYAPKDGQRDDMLVLHSSEDEALRFLESMVVERNPLRRITSVRLRPGSAVIAGWRTAEEVNRIKFPTLRTLAGFAHIPLRLVTLVTVSLSTLVRSVVGVMFQRRLWKTLKEYAIGVSGCPLPVSRVMYVPKYVHGPSSTPVTWNLDRSAVGEALAARRNSLNRAATLLSSPLGNSRASELIGLLIDLFTNIDLVHAAYYSRNGGIRQVAAWIEISAEEREIRSARFDAQGRVDFAARATHVSRTLAGYDSDDLAADTALLEALEKRENQLRTTLSPEARKAYDERTREAFHPFVPS